MYPDVVETTPGSTSNGCSMHQKQPPRRSLWRLRRRRQGFAVCAFAAGRDQQRRAQREQYIA
jgi:hypothetical protein